MATISFLTFTGCADAIVNDGTNVVVRVPPSSNGSGALPPFHSYNDVWDLQIWPSGDSCSVSTDNEAMTIIRSTSFEWWGFAICSAPDVNDEKATVKYDLSSIAKITFEAKADEAGKTFYLNMCTEDGKQEFETEKEYTTYTYDVDTTKSGNHYAIISIGSGASNPTTNLSIKNITFWDKNGNEVVPTVVN